MNATRKKNRGSFWSEPTIWVIAMTALVVAFFLVDEFRQARTLVNDHADCPPPLDRGENPGQGICSIRLNRGVIEDSLDLATRFLMAHQRAHGNFNYMYDWVTRTFEDSDNQVRQAGAAWGLALLYHHRPDPEVGAAAERALNFFARHSRVLPGGQRYVIYPDASEGLTRHRGGLRSRHHRVPPRCRRRDQ